MTPLRTQRSLFEVLVWVPGAFYAVATGKAVAFDAAGNWGPPLVAAFFFLLLAAAHRAQAKRIDQLEQALLERRSQLGAQPAAGASPFGGAGGGTRV